MGSIKSYRKGLRALYVFAFLNIIMMTVIGIDSYYKTTEVQDLKKQLLEKTCEIHNTSPEFDISTIDGFLCGTSCKGNTYRF